MHRSPEAAVLLRRLLAAAALAVLSAASARAQITGPIPNTGYDDGSFNWNLLYGIGRERTPEEAGREYEIERKYQETLRTKIPDKKPSNDPWKGIRQAPAASAPDRHRPQ